jgi:CRP/FNR family transcriptional regulator, cyclic AMP receptor protein
MVATVPRLCTWYIRHVDVFRRLTPRDADELARALAPRRFDAGQLIVSAETRAEAVYLTRAGTVRLFYDEGHGRETTVDHLERGHLFGVTSLLPSTDTALLAQADTDVEVCVAEGRGFLDIVSRWPAAVLEIALGLGVRVRHGEELLGRMTATGARARLASALHRRAQDASDTHPGGGLRLRGVPRHSELAEEIGATRETVTRMLARLEHDGYIRRFGRQIVVPDAARLADDFDLRP